MAEDRNILQEILDGPVNTNPLGGGLRQHFWKLTGQFRPPRHRALRFEGDRKAAQLKAREGNKYADMLEKRLETLMLEQGQWTVNTADETVFQLLAMAGELLISIYVPKKGEKKKGEYEPFLWVGVRIFWEEQPEYAWRGEGYNNQTRFEYITENGQTTMVVQGNEPGPDALYIVPTANIAVFEPGYDDPDSDAGYVEAAQIAYRDTIIEDKFRVITKPLRVSRYQKDFTQRWSAYHSFYDKPDMYIVEEQVPMEEWPGYIPYVPGDWPGWFGILAWAVYVWNRTQEMIPCVTERPPCETGGMWWGAMMTVVRYREIPPEADIENSGPRIKIHESDIVKEFAATLASETKNGLYTINVPWDYRTGYNIADAAESDVEKPEEFRWNGFVMLDPKDKEKRITGLVKSYPGDWNGSPCVQFASAPSFINNGIVTSPPAVAQVYAGYTFIIPDYIDVMAPREGNEYPFTPSTHLAPIGFRQSTITDEYKDTYIISSQNCPTPRESYWRERRTIDYLSEAEVLPFDEGVFLDEPHQCKGTVMPGFYQIKVGIGNIHFSWLPWESARALLEIHVGKKGQGQRIYQEELEFRGPVEEEECSSTEFYAYGGPANNEYGPNNRTWNWHHRAWFVDVANGVMIAEQTDDYPQPIVIAKDNTWPSEVFGPGE